MKNKSLILGAARNIPASSDAVENGATATIRFTRDTTSGSLPVLISTSGSTAGWSDYSMDPLIPTFADGHRGMLVLEAALRSAAEGGWVAVAA